MATSSGNQKEAADTSSSSLDGPICVVCGDKANGMHYRAMTCEGCKTFFRRNARNHLNLTCEMGGGRRCEMDLYTRRHCAACRMKKCLGMGMQIDRLWDKDRLKTRKPITKKATTESANPTSEQKTCETLQEDSNSDLAALVMNAYAAAAAQSLPPQSDVPKPDHLSSSERPESSSFAGPSASLPETLPQSLPQTSGQEIDIRSKVGQHIAENLKSIEMPNGFGEIPQALFLRTLDILLGLLKHMINFAKNLPGFLSLDTEDQATLIKASFLEYIIISSASLYNPQTKSFQSELWPEEDWDAEKIDSVGFRKIYSSVVDVAVKILKLQPTRTELTLLYAISIFTPERKDLCNSVNVEKIQQEMIQALRHSIEKRTVDSVGQFAKMIMLLTDVKNVTDVFLEDVFSMQLQGAVLSPIMMEMFSN